MIVACNTSPITSLAAIGHFELLRELFGRIHIAQGVWYELNHGGRRHPGSRDRREGMSMRKPAAALIWVLLSAGCASAPAPKEPAMNGAAIDHVIVGISDLEEGIRKFAELTGVTAERGGQHPGRGTQNALLSLGPHTYLEIIAPVAGPAPGMEFLSTLQELTPIGWAIGTTDLDGMKGRLEAAGFKVSTPRAGSRVRPDGQRLEWRAAGLADIPGELTPFLIEWGAQTRHPATTSPKGCTLESMEIQAPQVESLAKLVAELRLGAVVREAADEDLILTLVCPAGRVKLSRSKHP